MTKNIQCCKNCKCVANAWQTFEIGHESVANSVLQRMERRGVIEKGKLRAVYRSPTFPTTGYGHAHNLHPELVAKIKTAFFTWDFDDDPLYKKEFAKADKFIGIRHMNDWAVIRQIDTANGVSYDCK